LNDEDKAFAEVVAKNRKRAAAVVSDIVKAQAQSSAAVIDVIDKALSKHFGPDGVELTCLIAQGMAMGAMPDVIALSVTNAMRAQKEHDNEALAALETRLAALEAAITTREAA
jgi:hypothetical protein